MERQSVITNVTVENFKIEQAEKAAAFQELRTAASVGRSTYPCRTAKSLEEIIAQGWGWEALVSHPPAKAGGLCLNSTATLSIFADVQLWLHRSTHRGQLTSAPYSSSLAG